MNSIARRLQGLEGARHAWGCVECVGAEINAIQAGFRPPARRPCTHIPRLSLADLLRPQPKDEHDHHHLEHRQANQTP